MLPITLEDRYAPLVTREMKEKAEPAGVATLWGSFIRERWKEAVVLLVVLSLEKWINFAPVSYTHLTLPTTILV